MEATEAILGRRSIRKYEDRAVEPEKIDTLLRAGMAAPSAGNQQSWRFVVTDRRSWTSWPSRPRTRGCWLTRRSPS